jgi:hypothetical protein
VDQSAPEGKPRPAPHTNRTAFANGISRSRFPVAAKIALATGGIGLESLGLLGIYALAILTQAFLPMGG